MTTSTVCPTSEHVHLPCLNRVAWQQPLVWLKSGWEDFLGSWSHSLAYGIVFALLGYGLVHIGWSHEYMAMTLTTGFMLVSPFLAVVFYDRSRRREQPGAAPFSPISENLASIGLFAVLLMFILSAWERISAILVGLYLGSDHVPDASLSWLFSSANLDFVIVYAIVGALLAAAVFAISVVSLPMLMDRKVDIVTAVVTSLWTVRENPLAMLVWATAIVLLTGIGIATWFIGLVVIFPVLGHASWHAYRDLVQR
jgi:uncharacterized membrane protein